jgi:hypothetical protein
MRGRLVPLCTLQLAAGLREPAGLAGATLLHATANRHEWLAWLRGAGVPDLRGAREQLFDTVDMCVQSAERGLGDAIADAALFTGLIASGSVVRPLTLRSIAGVAISLPIRLRGGSSGIFGCLKSRCWLRCGGEGPFACSAPAYVRSAVRERSEVNCDEVEEARMHTGNASEG